MKNAKRPSRIAFVDEDFNLRQLVRHAFEQQDPDSKTVLATCGGGQELLSRIRELQPNLILLDLHMTEMNGPDTLDFLRNNDDGKEIPVIFMTTKTKMVMEAHYKSLGVIGVLYKPFDVKTLPREIIKIWEGEFGVCDDATDGRVLSELMDDGASGGF